MVTDSTSQADDTTAFLRAARSGNLEKVIEILDTDLDINTANSNGLNALHLASKDGHVEIVTELLKRGAKVDAATKKGNTALHIASLAGQSEIVNILIQYGASVNIQSQNGFTPLYMAAQENHDQVVKLLLSNGSNQSLATEDGFTPLAVAMQQGHDKVVSVLLENDSKGKVRLPALHIAAKKNDCKAADLLLQNDHKPDVTSKSGFTPLHIAAHYGNEDIARLLIKRGADVNYLAKHNISPLHVAAKWGKNNMVKILLENSAMIDAKTRDGLTPLHCAARSGHEQVVSTLLENSAPISARTKNGLAPLHMASQGDHIEAARVLLYHRAPVDEVTIDYLTSLHVAAHCGHVRVAKLLLDRKADPNARALNGFTPLHIACKKNRIKVVELLVKHGASIESTTESGLTPLHVASFMGCMNIVIFLLQHEANPDVPTVRGETPLHLAARANQTDIIRILLRNGAKVDARAREQQTPLHIASRLGNIDIVMLLLQHGAAVDTTTKDMYTALHIAAKEGQEEVAAILVENNASLKATTKNGFTPLHIAAKYGNMNVAKILLQKDSRLDAQGKNDITPLHLACHYDHPNVANLLLERGVSPHLATQNGHTPLHIAARKNQMEIASALLDVGVNPNAESKAGFTPLHLSAQKGHYDMTNLLIEHGADANRKAKNGLTALHLCAQEDFIRVASILVKNNANIESQTETGYRPIHIAAHFGNLSMIRFLLKHNAEIDVKTNQNYTPLHQAAQQGHAHVVTALLEGNASHKAHTIDGLTALNIAQKLGYISVMEVLKGLTYDRLTPDNKNWEEKYKVIAPESLQETSFMSDSDDEGGSDALISEQPYRYLTADLMKSLRDDSLPIDVTRDDPIHRQVSKEEKQEFTQSNNYCLAENFDTNDGINLGFLVSFLVDARGGAMKGCRHSGVRIIIPPRRATMPIRITCRLVKPNKIINPPPLMDGEALATRIIEMGPVKANFLGPVLIDIPHFASVHDKEREIIILKSENGETWKEHDNPIDNDETLLNTPYDTQMNTNHPGRIVRVVTTEFPQYFAIITRIKQEVHVIGAEGGILISSVANHVQAVFPPGALTKKIKVGLQAHVIPAELTAKLLGNCVAVSPAITIEPRRRKFHKPITLTIPVPQAANKGMINQYGGETPTLRLLCSITGGTSEAQWEDVTGSTPLTFMNDRVSFTTTVSARFWLMDCRNINEVPKMAKELYRESLYVPFITNFIIYSKRIDIIEATLRILCMTDGKEGIHTLERQEEYLELVKSRDVETLDGKDLYIEFSGNLVPVTKSGVQLKFTFKAFRQNRLSFHVKVRDSQLDPVARMLFMREPKVAKGEPPQQPICVLNIVLPDTMCKTKMNQKIKEFEDSNKMNQIDTNKAKYKAEHKDKHDESKDPSPLDQKFITDTLQKEQTDAATIHESFAQKAACPLESVDASYPNKIAEQEDHVISPTCEKQTYSEKRKFWEDISRKRESYQRSESEMSRASQLTINESDSEYLHNMVSEEDETTEAFSVRSETAEDLNIPDMSECSVAEKAHYFEEQIQRELSKIDKEKTHKITTKTIDDALVKESKDISKRFFNKEEKYQIDAEQDWKFDKLDKLKRDLVEKEESKITKNLGSECDWINKQTIDDASRHLSDKDKVFTFEVTPSKQVESSKPIENSTKTDERQIIEVCKDMLNREREISLQNTARRKFEVDEVVRKLEKPEFGEQFIENVVEKAKPKVEVEQKKESKIPISAALAEKQKNARIMETVPSTSVLAPLKNTDESEEAHLITVDEKKKKFESRIPKRIVDSNASVAISKDEITKNKDDPIIITKNISSKGMKLRQEHSTTEKSAVQSFVKTFTEPEETFDIFTGTSTSAPPSSTKIAKAEHEASSNVEKKETTSLETSSETKHIFQQEEKEQIKLNRLSDSKITIELPFEVTEKKKIDSERVDKSAVEKLTMTLLKGNEVTIESESSRSLVKNEKEKYSKTVEDEKGILTKKIDTIKSREDGTDVAMKLQRDFPGVDKGESSERTETILYEEKLGEFEGKFDRESFIPIKKISDNQSSLVRDIERELIEGSMSPKNVKELENESQVIEARELAENLVESIENEIKNRASILNKEKIYTSDENYLKDAIGDSPKHDELMADDLTRKFENIKKKSVESQLTTDSTTTTDLTTVESLRMRPMLHEDLYDKTTPRDSISITEDLTRDEESSFEDKENSHHLSSSRGKLNDHDITMSASSISDQGEVREIMDEKLHDFETEIQFDFNQKDKMFSEVSGARVLEIIEPAGDSHSRQDSIDVPSIEMDECRNVELHQTISSLHESPAFDTLDKLIHDRDITVSPSTASENTNAEYSLSQEQQLSNLPQTDDEVSLKRTDSFEIASPPLISPRSKIKELQIQPVDWMIGDEKIEITETLEPSEAFNQELEAYESTLKLQGRVPSQESTEPESATKSSEDISTVEIIRSTDTKIVTAIKVSKFTVVPVNEQDFESELVENKLDVSCQELVDTLQREYEAKTPTEEYAESLRQIRSEQQEEAKRRMSDLSESLKKQLEQLKYDEPISSTIKSTVTSITTAVTQEPSLSSGPSLKIYDNTVETVIDNNRLKEKEPISEVKKEITEMSEFKQDEFEGEVGGELEITRTDDALEADKIEVQWGSKVKGSNEDTKRHIEKSFDKYERGGRSAGTAPDTCALKIKKDDLSNVDLSARYAITVLDQVVKKEIAEVKESLEAAKQDLIEELSENSETVIQIKDSPSEFQFKIQPESIPNDLPFLYRPPSLDQEAGDSASSGSPVAKPRRHEEIKSLDEDTSTSSIIGESTPFVSIDESLSAPRFDRPGTDIVIDKCESETAVQIEEHPSPIPVSRSGSDIDNRDDSSSLLAPRPAPRRRQKPSRTARKVTSESEADVGSSSGDSSYYQSCDYEIGSRPSSSDIEILQSTGMQSTTASEYETAAMSFERSSHPTSQEYHTAASTMSSHESMKSLNSLSSGQMGSIDSTSELSETLVPSEAELDDKEIDENLEHALDDDIIGECSDSSGSDIPIDNSIDKIDSNVPCRMKRSSEMIFQQIVDDSATLDDQSMEEVEQIEEDAKTVDSATATVVRQLGIIESVDIMTTRVSEDGIENVSTQVISKERSEDDTEVINLDDSRVKDEKLSPPSMESDSFKQSSIAIDDVERQEPFHTQQTNMSTSSTSAISADTIIEKEKLDRQSPDSDSFELVDKPDLIDDFVVIEEVGREAEEFDSEGKSIRISSIPQVTAKSYDRDVENLIAVSKDEPTSSQKSRTNELFEFESEESPPQISNEEQSHSYSDDEQYENSKKWMEMQFQADVRAYDLDYDRGPLEDIKEEEITDFEAGSSRFGSLGSHKESIGSVGSMRGSFGSTPDYDVLAGKKYFTKTADHDAVSLSSLQEFEHLENAVAAENSKRLQHCGSQDSVNNGSLPRRYLTSRSGHGDDISLSSLKDFEGLEKACREAHLIELRAREEEDLLEHESPENKYKLENLPRKVDLSGSTAASINPSTSGSDDYEKRIKEIDEIIRIAQSNVEKYERQDDTTEDISQIEQTDLEKAGPVSTIEPDEFGMKETNVMETSTDSLEFETDNNHPLCRSSDSLEMKTTLDMPSLSSDSLNNVKDTRETTEFYVRSRRISSDSLEIPATEQQDAEVPDKSHDKLSSHSGRSDFSYVAESNSSTSGDKKPSPNT